MASCAVSRRGFLTGICGAYPGALASQSIPDDSQLWKIENFRHFLEARKELLATDVSSHLDEMITAEES